MASHLAVYDRMNQNAEFKPSRVKVDDPRLLEFLDMLKKEGENGIYVLVLHEGRVVKAYRTTELVSRPD